YFRYSRFRGGQFGPPDAEGVRESLDEALLTEKATGSNREPLLHALAGLSLLAGDAKASARWASQLPKGSLPARLFAEESKIIEARKPAP
ncbi:MAG: hypothetical protein K1X53_16825, partial [Candidatus Sumerlaeaceae bacterium]|nr:hypothetical protein [Candidatus Sumerlaeaceae bacterium]